ncbi:MAG: hypothetical protein K2L45_07940 [Muribaculaceae bacterium]|nr:hypothetical protein [Muribaculaceae bacterium]
MAIYQRVCGRCGYSSGLENQMSYNDVECPMCGFQTFRSQIIHESVEEREIRLAEEEKRRKFGKICGVGIAAFIALVFPGILMLMLVHQITEIESAFWNCFIAIALSGALLLAFRRNIMTYLFVDGIVIVISTILAWCIKSFSPWSFAFAVLGNGWGFVFVPLLGILALSYIIPGGLAYIKKVQES